MGWCSRGWIAAWLLFALAAGGCSASSGVGTPGAAATDTSHGFTGSSSLSDFFSGSSATSRQAVAGAQPEVNCPHIEIRQGASTLSIGTAGDTSAMSLKYQGELTREARECSVLGSNVVMKIGVQGRIIIGPAGGPGQVDVPLRIAIVQATPGGARPIMTKLIHIPVTVGTDNALFTHVEDAMSFPLPTPGSLLDEYIAYVGFDPLAAAAQEKPKEKPKLRAKPKPAANAN